MTTHSKHQGWIASNRLNRHFHTNKPNRIRVGDITFIATRSGGLYLSILLDLYSRRIVGGSMSNNNNARLVKDCLERAIKHRQPASGLIHHTDGGSTYAMQSYRDTIKPHGIIPDMIPGMSRKGETVGIMR